MRVLLLVVILLAGCAAVPQGYEWVADPARPTCAVVIWTQISWEEMRMRYGTEAIAPRDGCVVYSGYSEEQARNSIRVYGESLYAHESHHIIERLSHPTGGS